MRKYKKLYNLYYIGTQQMSMYHSDNNMICMVSDRYWPFNSTNKLPIYIASIHFVLYL